MTTTPNALVTTTKSPMKNQLGKKKQNSTTITNKEKNSEDEFMAAAIGDVEWLKQSLKHAKQINYDKNGLAALHLASLHGRLDCVKLLVERFKHDVNLPSSNGWRPIHLAISNQTGKRAFTTLEYLLSKEANHSVTNEDGVTPIHQAASEGHIQCLKALIEHGAKIYVKDYRGHTPLDLSKLWGHRQCARILATEQWHQEKDEVAKDMRRLKKTRMIDEINNLAAIEEDRAGKEFFGTSAYQEWLKTKGLESNIKGNKVKSAGKNKQPQVSGLYKPNSIETSRKIPTRQSNVPPETEEPPLRERTMDSFPDSSIYYAIHEKTEPLATAGKSMDKEKRKEIMSRQYYNDNNWNFSPQCDLLGHYQNDLLDCYPRDPITKLPHRLAAPAYLATHKNVPISAFSHPDAYMKERKVIFQPQNIIDAQTKVKHSEEKLMNKPQVFLNICNAADSQLFQRGLYYEPFTVSSDSSSVTIPSPLSSSKQSSKHSLPPISSAD